MGDSLGTIGAISFAQLHDSKVEQSKMHSKTVSCTTLNH